MRYILQISDARYSWKSVTLPIALHLTMRIFAKRLKYLQLTSQKYGCLRNLRGSIGTKIIYYNRI